MIVQIFYGLCFLFSCSIMTTYHLSSKSLRFFTFFKVYLKRHHHCSFIYSTNTFETCFMPSTGAAMVIKTDLNPSPWGSLCQAACSVFTSTHSSLVTLSRLTFSDHSISLCLIFSTRTQLLKDWPCTFPKWPSAAGARQALDRSHLSNRPTHRLTSASSSV